MLNQAASVLATNLINFFYGSFLAEKITEKNVSVDILKGLVEITNFLLNPEAIVSDFKT